MSSGSIYILFSSITPNLVKIGLTTKDPDERAKELSSATGVPHGYVVVYHDIVSDCAKAEKEVHKRLDSHRINQRREFFEVSVKTAIEVVREVAALYPYKEVAALNPYKNVSDWLKPRVYRE
jgi:hypothetical protein